MCRGWIDSQAAKYDVDHFFMRFTPRLARSLWSQANRLRIEKLAAAGRMHVKGLTHVEAAKNDGRWDAAYAPPSQIRIPHDVAAALSDNGAARMAFEALGGRSTICCCTRS